MAEHTEAELKQAILERTRERWEAKQEPLLLSQLGPDLLARGVNFKEIIDVPMKKYIEENLGSTVRVISHPEQPQKVGIIPISEIYDFPPLTARASKDFNKGQFFDLINKISADSTANPTIDAPLASRTNNLEKTVAVIQSLASRDGSSRKFVYRPDGVSEEKIRAFLRLMDGLTFREIDSISIPLRTLLRMLTS